MKSKRNEWHQYIRNFRFHSIFLKNLLLVFCTIIIPVICVLVLSIYSYGNIQESEEKAYSETIAARIVADTNNLFEEIREKAVMISIHQDVQTFFVAESIEHDQFYDIYDILDYLLLYSATNEVIDSVYLYAFNSQVVISQSGRYAYDDFYDKECLELWEKDGDLYQINYLDRKIAGKQRENISFYYAGLNGKDQKSIVIININIGKLRKKLNYGEEISIAISTDEQILYADNDEYIGQSTELLDYPDVSGDGILVRDKLNQNNMNILVQIIDSPFYEKLEHIRGFIVLFIILMIFLALVVVVYISKKIYDPIGEIVNALEKNVSLNMESHLLQSKDELSYIMEVIYATDAKNKDIEKELVARLTLLKKAQTIALQAQINPHFIHNTLETINWMAIGHLGGENDISEMIDNLSCLLRISLEDSSTMVTIEQEVAYAEKYLYIQKKRFQDKFTVTWKIPEELKECKIIKMVFQPVFENAIKYGIKPFNGKGKIKVEACLEEGDININIWNSGKGLTPDKVNEINKSMKESVIKESNHLGLSNVNQRIRLLFGEMYGISISSVIGEGTTVVIKVPYQI